MQLVLFLVSCLALFVSGEETKRQAVFNQPIGQNTVNQISVGGGFFTKRDVDERVELGKRDIKRVVRQFSNQFKGPINQNQVNQVTVGKRYTNEIDPQFSPFYKHG
ncbi:unnamed protein product [Brachionus calyciflorus]|uniref:Uncharacterized protein n=1 Tax=Brachionus calyciflorus TaxID=104777 RepID=A0A813Z7R0_9BILA|nr:unnamed protein product [Brachionus calyciflorus]